MQDMDVNKLYRRTLFNDYRTANNICAEALEAGYEDRIVHAMLYRAGMIEGYKKANQYRRQVSEMRQEIKQLYARLSGFEQGNGKLDEILEAVKGIGVHCEEVAQEVEV